ncbi:MAG: fluoride efflux transporter FluC [Hyphomicrobium sp.]
MKLYLLVMLGGAVGALSRVLVNEAFLARGLTSYPYGTLTVNVVGSFFMGIVMTLVIERYEGWPEMRALVAAGFLGGLTTFSAFSFDAVQLATSSDHLLDVRTTAYVVASVVLSIAALVAGTAATRSLLA